MKSDNRARLSETERKKTEAEGDWFILGLRFKFPLGRSSLKSSGDHALALRRRRARAATPARPVPKRSIVIGSGTGLGLLAAATSLPPGLTFWKRAKMSFAI